VSHYEDQKQKLKDRLKDMGASDDVRAEVDEMPSFMVDDIIREMLLQDVLDTACRGGLMRRVP
jgi:hypothetical protein